MNSELIAPFPYAVLPGALFTPTERVAKRALEFFTA